MSWKERKIWIIITVVLFISLLFSIFIHPVFSMGFFESSKKKISNAVLENVLSIVKKNYYIDPGNDKKLFEGAAKGIVETLNDPYSAYYTEKELKARLESLEGKFGGIGAWVGLRDGYVTIIKPIKGYPAYEAGLMAGDKIIEVDGKNVVGMSLEEVISLLKGDPGTKVTIMVKREGIDEPLKFELVRKIIKIHFVKWGKVDKNIAYLRLEQFGENADTEFRDALEDIIDKNKMKGIIIDLRGNTGGYLQTVLNILDLFFPKKLLVYTKGRNPVFNKKYFSSPVQFVPDKIKLVVLVDGGTASASEIFTGVMKDYKRAIIIGTKTFGKGLVQQIFEIPGNGAVILTVSQYFTPSGRKINKKGIQPDIKVEEMNLSDIDKFKLTIILREQYIRKFVKKYGKNYKNKDFENFKKLLKEKNLLLSDFILKKLIFNEIHKDDVDLLFTIKYDLQMKKAYEVIKKLLKK